MESNIEEIKSAIRFSLNKDDIFQSISDRIQSYFEKAATNIFELKQNTTKTKGDIFEVFCKLYLLNNYDYYTQVWLLSEVPVEILEKLNMRRADRGIDMIAIDKYNNYYCIQCKYRIAPKNKKNVLSWSQLSTFYALAARTGPWYKQIVMTNCDYIRREGRKTSNDLSICIKTFTNTDRNTWVKILGSTGNKLNENSDEKKSEEKQKVDIKVLRSKFLEKLNL